MAIRSGSDLGPPEWPDIQSNLSPTVWNRASLISVCTSAFSRQSTALCPKWLLWMELRGVRSAQKGSSAWLTRSWSQWWPQVGNFLMDLFWALHFSSTLRLISMLMMMMMSPSREIGYNFCKITNLESGMENKDLKTGRIYWLSFQSKARRKWSL